MAQITKDCGCNAYKSCDPRICTSYSNSSCDNFNLTVSNTEDESGITNISDVTLDVQRISAFKDHLEFVNIPQSLGTLVGHTVLRLSSKFLNTISGAFRARNVGMGASVYKGATVVGSEVFQDFKKLKDSPSIKFSEGANDITANVDVAWIKSLFTSGAIDICDLIKDCEINLPPTIVGDVVYDVENRVVNLPLIKSDFTSKYYDVNGYAYSFIKITGGDLAGLVKANLQPLTIGDIIPVDDIPLIKYSGPNQDAAIQQVVDYVAINSNGQQSN